MTVRIALDAMGGDHGPAEIIPATLFALDKHEELSMSDAETPEGGYWSARKTGCRNFCNNTAPPVTG